MIGFVIAAIIGTLGFAAYIYFKVKSKDTGTPEMTQIAYLYSLRTRSENS